MSQAVHYKGWMKSTVLTYPYPNIGSLNYVNVGKKTKKKTLKHRSFTTYLGLFSMDPNHPIIRGLLLILTVSKNVIVMNRQIRLKCVIAINVQ